MIHRIKLPRLAEDLESAVVIEWHVQVGDQIEAGSRLVSVELDKVDSEIPSPVTGTVSAVLASVGDEVAVGDPICLIES